MEKESNISLGWTIILLALFPQTTFGKENSIMNHAVGGRGKWGGRNGVRIQKYTPLYQNGIKKHKNKPIETSTQLFSRVDFKKKKFREVSTFLQIK